MYLSERLNAFKERQYLKVPKVILDRLHNERMKILSSGFLENALKKGDKVPNFSMENQSGELVKLSEILESSTLVLSFFRGGWCNYDGMELQALRDYYANIINQGSYLLTISPEAPSNSLKTHKNHELPFDILYDHKSTVAKQFGISYELTETIQDIYEAYGIDISSHNGDGSCILPVPATYIIAQDFTLSEAFIDMDHTKRMEPEIIIEQLKSLTGKYNACF